MDRRRRDGRHVDRAVAIRVRLPGAVHPAAVRRIRLEPGGDQPRADRVHRVARGVPAAGRAPRRPDRAAPRRRTLDRRLRPCAGGASADARAVALVADIPRDRLAGRRRQQSAVHADDFGLVRSAPRPRDRPRDGRRGFRVHLCAAARAIHDRRFRLAPGVLGAGGHHDPGRRARSSAWCFGIRRRKKACAPTASPVPTGDDVAARIDAA